MILIKDGMIFSLLCMVKCYLYLTKFANLVIRTNCTVLCLNMTSLSLASEQVQGKSLPQEAEVAQGVPCRLRPRIFLTFGTTRVVGRQPYVPAAFTPEEIPGTHF
jgi:hypothetical protein